MVRKLIVIVALMAFVVWAVDWLGLNRGNQSAVSNEILARSALLNSQADKAQQEAAKIQQEVRRQNEMDDGIAINVGARVVTNDGITAAEKIGSFFSNVSLMVCLVPWGVLCVLYIIWRFSRPVVRRADDNGYDYE